MSDTWIEKAIVQSIDLIVNKRISQASYDTTIKAIVKSCSDKTIGEYIVRYQDSDLTVYASSVENHYVEGDQVLIHVPMNNLTKRKTILGSTTSLATTYKQIPQASELYNKIGINAVTTKGNFGILSSYINNLEEVYPGTGAIQLNQKAINDYIKRGNGLAIGCYIRTSFADSQTGGDYGVIINLKFVDVNGDAAVRPYILSSADVIGNPYNLIAPTFVEYFIDDINIDEFEGIQSIQVYSKGFPIDESKNEIMDIFFSDLQIFGASGLTENELSGYSLHLNYSQNGDTLQEDITQLNLTAELKVKGQLVTKDVQYYWFRQNGEIFKGTSAKGFSTYGGDGWECINYYQSDNSKPVPRNDANFKFVATGQNNTQNESIAAQNGTAALLDKKTKIKCVAVMQGKAVAEGQCILKNNFINFTFSIVSSDLKADGKSNREIYYLDNGNPTLTCVRQLDTENVNEGNINFPNGYKFYWTIIPARGEAINCNEGIQYSYTEDQYHEPDEDNPNEGIINIYNTIQENLKQILGSEDQQKYLRKQNFTSIKSEVSPQTQYYPTFKAYVQKLLGTKPVIIDGNVFKNFSIASIVNYSTIVCTVYEKKENGEKGIYKGKASITLYNKLQLSGMYSLNLENGTQVFQYDNKGNSPTSKQLEKPLVIKPLSFTLLDQTGKEIPFIQIINEANQGYVKWFIPKENTMLSYNGEAFSIAEENQNFDEYDNIEFFDYAIADRYDSKKRENYIKLQIKYKDIILETYSNFTFPKDGDPGTNGTDYVVKIVPYGHQDAETIYINNHTRTDIDNSTNPEKPFDNQGREVDKLEFLMYNNSNRMNSSEYTAHSEILKGTTNSLIKLVFPTNDEEIGKYICYNSIAESASFDFKDWIYNNYPINIVRQYVQINGVKYYAEYPICFNYVYGNEKYRFKLKPKTGFQYVKYAEDGTLPDYDNTKPFEIIVQKALPAQNNDVYYQQQNSNQLSYEWTIIGHLKIKQGANTNICTIEPSSTFDGKDLFNAVLCEIKRDNNIIGYLHIPVYMYINRFGHAALNEWDGNSIDLGDGENNKSTILAPQVGAGKKNDNTFTGVLMGVQYTPSDIEKGIPQKNQTGLFGYESGQRSIFLDAETGNAIFGKDGAAQIKIDARSDQGTIASGDYDFTPDSHDGKGMKIKFSSTGEGDEIGPYIRFGSNKFSVNADGEIHAAGGGDIAGWHISDERLEKQSTVAIDGKYPLTGMNSEPYSTHSKYAPANSDQSSRNYWQVGNLARAFRAGYDQDHLFYVTHDGYLYSSAGKIADWIVEPHKLTDGHTGLGNPGNDISFSYKDTSTTIPSSSIRMWSNNNFIVTDNGKLFSNQAQIGPWNVSSTAFTDGKTGLGEKTANLKKPFGFKEDTSRSLRFWSYSGDKTDENENLQFAVTAGGGLYSRSGKIGGWTIGDKTLSSTVSSTEGITISAEGSIFGGVGATNIKSTNAGWQINKNGNVFFNKGSIGAWQIGSDYIGNSTSFADSNVGLKIYPPDDEQHPDKGELKANLGTIGECTINDNGLSGRNWEITGGHASFKGLKIGSEEITTKGTAGISGGGGSWGSSGGSFGGGGGGLSWGGPGQKCNLEDKFTIGKKDNKTYIKDLVVDKLKVLGEFVVGGNKVGWKYIYYVTGVKSINGSLSRETITYVINAIGTTASKTVVTGWNHKWGGNALYLTLNRKYVKALCSTGTDTDATSGGGTQD